MATAARTTGPHFFVDAVEGDHAVVAGDEARHLGTVLRAHAGDPVSIADGSGAVWQGRVAAVAPDAIRVALVDRHDVPATSPRIVVAHGLPKGRKLDEVVQRLSELGVDALVPVRTRRSQVVLDPPRAAKVLARWRAVALAAAKQSRRARILEVRELHDLDEATSGARGLVLWEDATTPLRDVVAGLTGAAEVLLVIGAEGGLEPSEVEATGLPAATLGPTVLRTETAAVVAATAVGYALGRIG